MHLQVHRVLKLLESPYDPVLSPTDSVETFQGSVSVTGKESEATAMPDKSPQVKQQLNSYFSKPPEWSLGLCVT